MSKEWHNNNPRAHGSPKSIKFRIYIELWARRRIRNNLVGAYREFYKRRNSRDVYERSSGSKNRVYDARRQRVPCASATPRRAARLANIITSVARI